MQKISYFLSYAYSIAEGIESGSIDRTKKELGYLSRYYLIDVYSKDSNRFLAKLPSAFYMQNVRYFGIPFSTSDRHLDNARFLRKISSILMLIEYYFLLPFIYRKQLKSSSAAYICHVSGAFAAIMHKYLFNSKLKVIIKYSWNWSLFIKKDRNAIEQKIFSFFERVSLNGSDMILPATEEIREYIEKIIKKKKDIRMLPNWVDCDQFTVRNQQKEYDIINVGRLAEQKNHLLLLESVKEYYEEYGVRLKILIIGSGHLREKISGYARDNSLNVTIVDKVKNDMIAEYYNKSRIFVMPSLYEGHPKSLLEAMACGIPAIGTDVTGINSVIENNYNGLVCREGSGDIKEMMHLLITDIEKMRDLGKNARTYILANFSFNSIVEKLRRNIE
ncbi:MAG: glycosyltransferase family 4 protein [Candidatus Omnitrophica bacterium]|nr:glycosyltransferase family 4 protein [Candidatus Omnitrophota bacterium]